MDLAEAFLSLWRGKWVIAGVTFLFSLAGVTYALLATPIYRAEVVLTSNEPERGPGIPAGVGGLASMVGIDLGFSAGGGAEALATLRSRAFIEEFIRERDLLPILFADRWDREKNRWIDEDPETWPDLRDGVRLFARRVRSISEDASTGLITLTIKWTDPELAATWADQLVHRINERLRTRDLANSQRRLEYLNGQLDKANLVELRQAISRLIESEIQTVLLAQVETEYAFKVIDPARVPRERDSPKRTLIVLLSTLLGGVIGALGVLLLRGTSAGRSTKAEQ